MKTENRVLMQEAREVLRGNWKKAVWGFAIGMLASIAFGSANGLLSLLVSGPLAVGMAMFALSFSRGQNPNPDIIFFHGFKRITVALTAYLLVGLYVLLWALLLIIPGIVAAIGYSMTFFIIAEDSNIGAKEAMAKSKKMMEGYKWKYFTLNLRFLGWIILSILSIGIGFLWLIPYMEITLAKFYDDLKEGGEVAP